MTTYTPLSEELVPLSVKKQRSNGSFAWEKSLGGRGGGGVGERYSLIKKEKKRERKPSSLESLLLIRAHRLPLINNFCITSTTDVIPKHAALKMPASNWIDVIICTTRGTQPQSEEQCYDSLYC